MSPDKSKDTQTASKAWWKEAAVYQIYPASFCDHADSGHGTLRGMLSRIPYFKQLGIDIIWLSPIYRSPQADMGYDISDYRAVDPRYGTMQDWENVRDAIHEQGMKLVMDLVVNHTSDQHEWFKESRSSRTNPKRDWYIWRPPRYSATGERLPPNNWSPTFGSKSAWEWDEATQEYYLHLFLKEQPDLNWENPEVRKEIWAMMHWWLEQGVDGFRMDVINFIAKSPGLPDAPEVFPDKEYQPFGRLSINRPEVHHHLKEMHREVLQRYDCFCGVGETPGDGPVSEYAPYSNPSNKELQMVFHFHHQSFDRKGGGLGRTWNPDWKLVDFKSVLNNWQVKMEEAGGWNSNYIENHDQPRIVSRLTSDHPLDRAKCAKLISMLHTTLTGTLFIFQGEEIGMVNFPRDWGEEEYKDVETRTAGEQDPNMIDLLEGMRMTARDNGRTPMQWDATENAGFSKGTPWMRVHDDYQEWNVAKQMADGSSVWAFWKKMLSLRKEYQALIYGTFHPLDESNENIYVYTRHDPCLSQTLLIVLNLARGPQGRGEPTSWDPKKWNVDLRGARLLMTNGDVALGAQDQRNEDVMELEPWEGRIYLLSSH
ncbi:hypothetical protein TREMEDRAFT_66927 [Tremella mesenterica DSM 1558]|uniref:uncharacterized protein n=1 Tax=Tremella mesenterica (strain ATCC 24925 / CBS 8224 / DSM 1558 / NBRC 9311 / NRRL Y-6157 / RJB 2259-6 / UBC 559-6) TaxID=578456 RepID=UPI0003F48CBE|nr:uncharacterized protein TREMEDRAFT_66927 [Tremella mesenterica DSM 1558]EIW72517.1 hypothetical protein TREMEDRAFT_66927 [Tremella mesenterica DSM 1558]